MPLYINIIKFQEKNLNLNRDSNSDSSMVERQARDLEVRIRVPVQDQIFLLKFDNVILYTHIHIYIYIIFTDPCILQCFDLKKIMLIIWREVWETWSALDVLVCYTSIGVKYGRVRPEMVPNFVTRYEEDSLEACHRFPGNFCRQHCHLRALLNDVIYSHFSTFWPALQGSVLY